MDDNMTSNGAPTLKDIYEAVDQLRKDIATNYVTKDAFDPVRNIVYGLVGVVMLGVIGALVALVLHTSPSAQAPQRTTNVQVNPGSE